MDDVTFQEFLEELDLKLGSDANSSFLWEDDLAKPQPDFNLNKFEDGHSQGLFENHMIGGTEGGNNIFNICGDGDVNFPEVNFPNEKPVDSLDTHPENLQLPLLVEENDISTTRYENDFAYSDFQVFQEQFVPRDFHDLGCREPVHLQDKVTLSQKETDAEGHFANFFEKDEHLPVPPLTGSNPPSDTTIPWTHSSPSVSYGQEMPKCSKSKDLKHNSKILESKSSEDDGAAKKLQRLIRNRASASESRMRRKSYVADLENKCKSLESQLNSLRQIASISAMENGLLRDQLLRMQQLFPAAVINGSSIKSSAGFLQHQSAETGKINGKNVPPESEVSEEGNGRLAEPAALESGTEKHFLFNFCL